MKLKSRRVSLMGCSGYVKRVEKPVAPIDFEEAKMVMLAVDGMGCPNGATRVYNSLINLEGVLEAHVYLNLEVAEVIFDPGSSDPADFVMAVSSAREDDQHDYQARVILR